MLRRKNERAIMDQVFQPVCRDVQRNDLASFLLAKNLFLALHQEQAINLRLDLIKLGLPIASADASTERIKRILRLLLRQRRTGTQDVSRATPAPRRPDTAAGSIGASDGWSH